MDRTAWCGVTVPEKARTTPWPITCKKCCREIRKARLRQIELQVGLTGKRHQEELAALNSANWPMQNGVASRKVTPAASLRTLVKGPSKPWPKEITFTSKDVDDLVQLLGPGQSPDFIKRLWISEAEEQQILKALESFPKPVGPHNKIASL